MGEPLPAHSLPVTLQTPNRAAASSSKLNRPGIVGSFRYGRRVVGQHRDLESDGVGEDGCLTLAVQVLN